MAKKNEQEITCEVIFTEGAVDRITDAFVDLYEGIMKGVYQYTGPWPEDGKKKETA